jgi:phospholipid/cholesterol/gamma-HCH transport system substrate-binding protein
MQKQQRNELIVGLVFFFAMIFLGLYTIVISGIFKGERKTYWVSFPTIYGLKKGDQVRVEGLECGEVSHLAIVQDTKGDDRIRAQLSVSTDVHIYKDGSEVKVTPFSPLGGRIIEIRRGFESERGEYTTEEDAKAKKLQGPDIIPGHAEGELLQTLNQLVEDNKANVKKIVDNLAYVSDRLTKTDSVIGALLNDPGTGSMISDMADQLARTGKALNNIMTRIEHGEGIAGELVAKKSALHDNLNAAVEHANGALGEAQTMLATANKGRSAVGVLVSDDEYVTADAKHIVRDISLVTSDVAAGKGSLGLLVKDDRLYNGAASTAENLAAISSNIVTSRSAIGVLLNDQDTGTAIKSTLRNLDSISRSVDEGKGAFGLVVKDQQFRDRIQRIFTEVERLTVEFRDSVEDLREQAPVNAFLGAVFAAF